MYTYVYASFKIRVLCWRYEMRVTGIVGVKLVE